MDDEQDDQDGDARVADDDIPVWNYERIRALSSRGSGLTAADLIVLEHRRDPFYLNPRREKLGRWFLAQWRRLGYDRGVHLRRMHYALVSTAGLTFPDGTPYENTLTCSDLHIEAAAAARYMGLLDPALMVDHRNPAPHLYLHPALEVVPTLTFDEYWREYRAASIARGSAQLWLSSLPELPDVEVSDFVGAQRYHIEVWAEKSTMNDILLPLCETYGANLMTGAGELSITQVAEAAHRIADSAKPVRIVYLSDFDPAGEDMPVSAGRKLQWFVSGEHSPVAERLRQADIKLFPLLLTAEQCRAYGLHATPLKKGEQRSKEFKERWGVEGATELDALEAQVPGTLGRLVLQAVRTYYDADLPVRVTKSQRALQAAANSSKDEVLRAHAEALEAIQSDYRAVEERVRAELEDLNTRIIQTYQLVAEELQDALDDLDLEEFPVPEAAEAAADIDVPLYDSGRDYVEQVAAFKRHQGKTEQHTERKRAAGAEATRRYRAKKAALAAQSQKA